MKRFVVLLFIVPAFFSACSTTRWVNDPVSEQKYLKVSLEHQLENNLIVEKKFNQPYEIDPAKIKLLLKELIYLDGDRMARERKKSPVFQDKEVTRLVPALVDALSRATPNQRIRFISLNRARKIIFKTKRKTDGVIFIDSEGRLNIAFNLINLALKYSDMNGEFDDLSTNDPLNIKTSKTHLIPLLPYARHHVFEDGTASPMWIVVSLDKFQETFNVWKQTQTPQEGPPSKTILKDAPVTEGTELQQVTVQPDAKNDNQMDKIKKDLEFLKELFNSGLITEQEHSDKKRKLLDKIE